MKIFEKLSTRIVKDQIYDYIPIKRRQFIQQLPGLYKNEFVKKMVDQLPKGEQKAITIRRRKALMFKEKGQIDHEGTKSMFGQMIQQIKSDFDAKVKCFCVNKADASIFKITFKGEGGSDHGGLYRDFITCVCNEIQSKVLPLLIQTPNNKSEHGENRDSFIINPASNKPTHLEMFKFFGYFLGMAIRSEQYLPLDLAPIFWKSLLDEHIVQSDQEKENDYRDMDLYSYQTLQYLKNKADQLSDQEFETEAHMKFVTHLSDGQEVEVCQDGWSKIVTKANVDEYIRLAIETRINESKQQVKAIIEGINFVMPKNIYCFFNWKQLELRATGAKLIDLDQLKAITKYDGCSKTDLYVQFFWQTLEGFTNYERSLYLKFVWGRTRLLSSGDTEHKVVSATYNEKSCLPKSATCFFKIYLPKYPTFEKCRNSMLTAISYCGDIDNDRVVSGNDSADED